MLLEGTPQNEVLHNSSRLQGGEGSPRDNNGGG